jgi:NTP pyrophosphatase (non-canonical NTP hydrolase)
MTQKEIFLLISAERERQDQIHPFTNYKSTDDEEVNVMKNFFLQLELLSVLGEEFGEVCRCIQSGDGDLKEELVQVASVCVRWLEALK